jgi:hypothetical protein
MENNKKKSQWGGFRVGAGRKLGSGEKTKICVSVDRKSWQSAVSKWNAKPSWLVETLLRKYLTEGDGL